MSALLSLLDAKLGFLAETVPRGSAHIPYTLADLLNTLTVVLEALELGLLESLTLLLGQNCFLL